jgi:hypothetical protein
LALRAAAMAGSSDSEGEGGPESRAKMLKRHKKEVVAAQKSAQRLGKKRADEAASLVAEVNARHAAELAELEARPAGEATAPEDAAVPDVPAAAPPPAAKADAPVAALAAATLADSASDGGSKARMRSRSRACASAVARMPPDRLLRSRLQKTSKAQLRRAKLAKEEARACSTQRQPQRTLASQP